MKNKEDPFMKEWKGSVKFWNDPRVESPVFFWDKSKVDPKMREVAAWIDIAERQAYFNMPNILDRFGRPNFQDTAVHGVGHDAYCPYDVNMCLLLDYEADKVLRNLGKVQYVENLFSDMMDNTQAINKGKKSMINLYQKIAKNSGNGSSSESFKLYLAACEQLWNQPKESLAKGVSEEMKGDAQKLDDIIRTAMKSDNPRKDWPDAMGEFAKVMSKYVKDEDIPKNTSKDQQDDSGNNNGNNSNNNPNSQGSQGGNQGGQDSGKKIPDGFIDYHSPKDFAPVNPKYRDDKSAEKELEKAVRGVARKMTPQQYKRLMSGTGLANPRKAVTWFYRDLAHQFDVMLPRTRMNSGGGTPSQIRKWNINDDIKDLDLLLSLEYGVVIPGETTLKVLRNGLSASEGIGGNPDVLICLDCSGSMPDPQNYLSVPVLSSMVVAHAAIRAERKVGVVLFSHISDHLEYTRDLNLIDDKLTDFLNGGTQIPAKLICDLVYENSNPQHIVVISDTEIFNMNSKTVNYLKDALCKAGAGGTVFLTYSAPGCSDTFKKIGYNVVQMRDKNNLLGLSLELSATLYGG